MEGPEARQHASTCSEENSDDDDLWRPSSDVGVEEKSDRGSMLNSPVGVWANEVPAAKVVNGNATGAESGQGSAVEQGSRRAMMCVT